MKGNIGSKVVACAALSALAPLLLAGFSAQRAPEETVPKIKAQATAVVVDVIVTDRRGRPVRNLPKDAFRVFENDAEQQVSTFLSPEEQAASQAATAAAPQAKSGSATAPPAAGMAPATTFITVVLDLGDRDPLLIRRSSEAVVRYLQKASAANTSVAIYYMGNGLRLALPFTRDFREAERALAQLEKEIPAGRMNNRSSVQQDIDELYAKSNPSSDRGGIVVDPGASSNDARRGPAEPFAASYRREIESMRSYLSTMNTFQAQGIFVALRALALSYRDLPGRKNVVLFSEGFAFSPRAIQQMEAVVEAANRANVSFYVIDPAGLGTGVSMVARGGNTRAQQMAEVAQEGIGQRGGESKFDRMRAIADQSQPHEQLSDLAAATGGLLIRNNNDVTDAFERVIDDSRSFYTLVYSPKNKDWNGEFRKIRVALARDGLQLRYRRGYWAIPRGEGLSMTPLQAHLLAASSSSSLRPAHQLTVRSGVALAADGKYYATVSVAIPAALLPLEKEGSEGKPLAFVAFARDPQGNVVAAYEQHWDLPRPANPAARVTIQSSMALPQPQPVRVEGIVQLAGGELAGGSAEAQFVMPSGPAPSLTSLYLTDQVEAAKCEDPSEAMCVANVRIRQPAVLDFPRANRMVAYVGAADLALDSATKLPRVAAEFVVRSGEKVLGAVPANNVQALPGPTPGSAYFVAQLNLKALPPGNYSLEAKVHDLVRKTAASHRTDFALN